MAKTILSDAGYEVAVVSNGAAAYKKIQESPPDILILDIFMPGYSGLEICEKIRAERSTASIPVLLTVGKMEPYRPEDGARVEADGVIVKPFEASDLLTVMQQFEAKITAARARTAPKTAAAPPPPPDPSQWSMPPAEEFAAEEVPPARSVEMSREEGSSAAFGDFFGEHEAPSSESADNFSATPESNFQGQASPDASTEDLTSGFTSAPSTSPAEHASFFSSAAESAPSPMTSPASETKAEFRPFSSEESSSAAAVSPPSPSKAEADVAPPKLGPNDTQPIYTNLSDQEPQKISATPSAPATAPNLDFAGQAAMVPAPVASVPPAVRATPPPPPPSPPAAHPKQEVMKSGWESPFGTLPAENAAAAPEADLQEDWESASAAPGAAKAQSHPPEMQSFASTPEPAAELQAVHQEGPVAGASPGKPGEAHEEDILDLSEAELAASVTTQPAAEVPSAEPPPAHAAPRARVVSQEPQAPAQRPKFASLPLDSAVDIAPEPETEDDDILEAQPLSRVHGFGATSALAAGVQSGFAGQAESDDILGESAGHPHSTGADPALIADPSEMANAFPTRFGLDNPEPAVVGLAADAPQIYTQPVQEPASEYSMFEDDILAETDDSPLAPPPAGGEQIHLIQSGVHTATAAPEAPPQESSAPPTQAAPAPAEKFSEDVVARLVQNVMEQLRPNLVAEITRQLKEQKPSV